MTCTHTGNYRIRSELHGLMPVRSYDCADCGASMAMDSLPRHLMRRMWGDMVRAAVPAGVLPPVDLVFILSGPTAVPLARVCFNSLARTCATLRGVRVHLVNAGLEYEDFRLVYRMWSRASAYSRPPVPSGSRVMGDDTEWSCEWATSKCGSEQFVVLCHFDLCFFGDFLNRLRSSAHAGTGMLGQHCPFWLINRRALAGSRLRFASAPGPFYATVRHDAPDQFFLYHGDDRRVSAGSPRTGFDVGELLELEMRARGWQTDAMREAHDAYFYHFSGGARVTGGPELESIRRRLAVFEEEYDLGGDPASALEELY